MEIIYILLPASLLLGLIGLGAYIWAVRTGQYDDLQTPGLRMLGDEFEEKVAPDGQISTKDNLAKGLKD